MDNFYAKKRKTANSDVVFWWYGAVDFSFFKRDAPHCSKMKPQRGNLRHRRSDGVKKPKASDYQTWSLLCVSQYFVQKGSLEPKRPKQVLNVPWLLLIAFELQTIAVNYMPGLFWRAQNNEAFWPWKLISKPKVVRDHLPISEMGKFSSSFYFKVVNLLLT